MVCMRFYGCVYGSTSYKSLYQIVINGKVVELYTPDDFKEQVKNKK